MNKRKRLKPGVKPVAMVVSADKEVEDSMLNKSWLLTLSLEILCHILDHLPLKDVMKMDHKSKKLHEAVSLHLRVRKKIDFTEKDVFGWMSDKITDKTLNNLLIRCRDVEYIQGLHVPYIAKRRTRGLDTLSVPGITEALDLCKNLKGIEISDIYLLEAVLAYLPEVEILGTFKNRIGNFPFDDANKLRLSENPRITSLHLIGVCIPDLPPLMFLKHLQLRWVHLSGQHPFMDFAAPQLQTFVMAHCGGPANSNPLKYVRLIASLATSQNLKRLELIRVPILGGLIQHVVEDSWRIEGFKKINHLKFGACKFILEMDVGYMVITAAPNMEELCLQPSLTKDSLFISLRLADVSFRFLQTLHLGFVDAFPEPGQWTNEDLAAEHLSDVVEHPAMVTDIGMKSVGQCFPELKHVQIYNCPHIHKPTAWLIPGAQAWSQLRELYLRRCHAVRLADFCLFIEQLPNLELLHLEHMFREPPKGCSRVGLSAGTGLGMSSALVGNHHGPNVSNVVDASDDSDNENDNNNNELVHQGFGDDQGGAEPVPANQEGISKPPDEEGSGLANQIAEDNILTNLEKTKECLMSHDMASSNQRSGTSGISHDRIFMRNEAEACLPGQKPSSISGDPKKVLPVCESSYTENKIDEAMSQMKAEHEIELEEERLEVVDEDDAFLLHGEDMADDTWSDEEQSSDGQDLGVDGQESKSGKNTNDVGKTQGSDEQDKKCEDMTDQRKDSPSCPSISENVEKMDVSECLTTENNKVVHVPDSPAEVEEGSQCMDTTEPSAGRTDQAISKDCISNVVCLTEDNKMADLDSKIGDLTNQSDFHCCHCQSASKAQTHNFTSCKGQGYSISKGHQQNHIHCKLEEHQSGNWGQGHDKIDNDNQYQCKIEGQGESKTDNEGRRQCQCNIEGQGQSKIDNDGQRQCNMEGQGRSKTDNEDEVDEETVLIVRREEPRGYKVTSEKVNRSEKVIQENNITLSGETPHRDRCQGIVSNVVIMLGMTMHRPKATGTRQLGRDIVVTISGRSTYVGSGEIDVSIVNGKKIIAILQTDIPSGPCETLSDVLHNCGLPSILHIITEGDLRKISMVQRQASDVGNTSSETHTSTVLSNENTNQNGSKECHLKANKDKKKDESFQNEGNSTQGQKEILSLQDELAEGSEEKNTSNSDLCCHKKQRTNRTEDNTDASDRGSLISTSHDTRSDEENAKVDERNVEKSKTDKKGQSQSYIPDQDIISCITMSGDQAPVCDIITCTGPVQDQAQNQANETIRGKSPIHDQGTSQGTGNKSPLEDQAPNQDMVRSKSPLEDQAPNQDMVRRKSPIHDQGKSQSTGSKSQVEDQAPNQDLVRSKSPVDDQAPNQGLVRSKSPVDDEAPNQDLVRSKSPVEDQAVDRDMIRCDFPVRGILHTCSGMVVLLSPCCQMYGNMRIRDAQVSPPIPPSAMGAFWSCTVDDPGPSTVADPKLAVTKVDNSIQRGQDNDKACQTRATASQSDPSNQVISCLSMGGPTTHNSVGVSTISNARPPVDSYVAGKRMIDQATSTSDPVIEDDHIQILEVKSKSLLCLSLNMVGITDLVLTDCPKLGRVTGCACRVLKKVKTVSVPKLQKMSFAQCRKLDEESLLDEITSLSATKNRVIYLRPLHKFDRASLEKRLFGGPDGNYGLCVVYDYNPSPQDSMYNRTRVSTWPNLFIGINLELLQSYNFRQLDGVLSSKYPLDRMVYTMAGENDNGSKWELITDIPWLRPLSECSDLSESRISAQDKKAGVYCPAAKGHFSVTECLVDLQNDIAEKQATGIGLMAYSVVVYINMCDVSGVPVHDPYI
ncbi:F-box only protein 38-like [Pecten maximus]|uniref:F-box only protein 38-like n=1 Tax=Pecten maximus TaxID=6579 RepID=UPI00145839CA|nr:F-box only protein 38-like [Pecten maximus]